MSNLISIVLDDGSLYICYLAEENIEEKGSVEGYFSSGQENISSSY